MDHDGYDRSTSPRAVARTAKARAEKQLADARAQVARRAAQLKAAGSRENEAIAILARATEHVRALEGSGAWRQDQVQAS